AEEIKVIRDVQDISTAPKCYQQVIPECEIKNRVVHGKACTKELSEVPQPSLIVTHD
ncbi:Hypothetical protein FKW44_015840, partial [Caligus rogercresseyi]